MAKGKIPEGWIGCPSNGKQLIVSKFMALKTPLSHRYDKKLPEENRYHPEDIFLLAKKNKVKFGLWIDLTNTFRYYDKEDIEKLDCKYSKLQCFGHGQCPSRQQTEEFIYLVNNFLSRAPSQCIAVHCTHGFNRTGFLISSFLVEKLKFNIATAIELFAKARPPGIYRPNYIAELHYRYGNSTVSVPCPKMPSWTKNKDGRQITKRRVH